MDETVKKPSYQTYFKYTRNQKDEKIGVCLICQNMNIVKEVKMKNGNTSGLKYHLNKDHKAESDLLFGPEKSKKNSALPSGQKTMDLFSHKKEEVVDWDKLICLWLAFKNLPLSFFNDAFTQKFFKLLNANVVMPKKDLMKAKVMEQFSEMQQNLIKILNDNLSKFSFAIDGWTARNGKSYYGIIINYIDEDWIYQSLALDLVPSNGKHTGKDIAKLFFKILKEYNIQEKVQGITLDNAAANTTFIRELKILMENENIDFDIEDQHFRCFAHITNLGVQDILKLMKVNIIENNYDGNETNEYYEDNVSESDASLDGDEFNDENFSSVIAKIRLACKKIRYSEQLSNRLKLFCEAANLKFVKLTLDVKTRWDSTYDMLNVAFKLKPALVMLWQNCPELSDCKIAEIEWTYLKIMLSCLKYFKHVSKLLSGETYITLPTVVVAFNILIDKLESIVRELDCKSDRNSTDEQLLLAFQAGRDKILKHYTKCNWIYCMCLILDPRHKKDCFDFTPWGKQMKNESITKFENSYYRKYFTENSGSGLSEKQCFKTAEIVDEDDCLDFKSVYSINNVKMDAKENELQNYYQAPRADEDVDILQWWKLHSKLYPNISKMARDILSTSATSVSVERLFSEGSLLMTNRRASLKDQSMRGLICLNSWSKSSLRNKICKIDI